MLRSLFAIAAAALLLDRAYCATTAVSYDFNDYSQMADWTVDSNSHHEGATFYPIGPEETWKDAGGVDGSGHVRMLHDNAPPNVSFTLTAHTFDRDSAHITFSVGSNNPDTLVLRFNDAWFFHYYAPAWSTGDTASLGGATWQNPTFNYSAMTSLSAPDWPGAVYNDFDVTIINGIVDITVNGEVLVTGADWNALLEPTGNVFRLESWIASYVALDNYAQGPADVPTSDGDFNLDGLVDGADFLMWQRGESTSPLSTTDLDAWKSDFGVGSGAAIVPEPSTSALAVVLFGSAVIGMIACRQSSRRTGR